MINTLRIHTIRSWSKIIFILFLLVQNLLFALQLSGQHSKSSVSNPVELGKVLWHRDFHTALDLSKIKNLPVFILFQEVPGCSNCTTYGREVLSHPLIVEAIESHFIPLCIYNNKSGMDKEILTKYNEPSWNNPVLRIVNSSGKDLCQRESDFRSKSKAVAKIIEGIKLSGQQVPKYLLLLEDEFIAFEQKSVETAYLSMYCFWTGEKEIAAINGILSTEAGYMHGNEVVKVEYDKSRTTLDKIAADARKTHNADKVYGYVQKSTVEKVLPPGIYKKDPEDKYYLRNSIYKVVPMTTLQKSKVNRALGLSQNPDEWLSPRQIKILADKKFQDNVVDKRIEDIWY